MSLRGLGPCRQGVDAAKKSRGSQRHHRRRSPDVRECRRMEGQGEAIPFPEWCRLSHGVSGERCRCHELSGLEPHPGLCRGTDAVPVSSAGIFRLFATLRTTSGARCQFRATCNPGGPGHHWVKNWIIDNGPYRPIKDAETGLIRIFIPAKINDNPALLNNDPNYINRLRASGSPHSLGRGSTATGT